MCSCSRYEPNKVIQKMQISLIVLIHFYFKIIASKCLFLRVFLSAREPLVITFSETRAVNLPKDIVERGMQILKGSEKHEILW